MLTKVSRKINLTGDTIINICMKLSVFCCFYMELVTCYLPQLNYLNFVPDVCNLIILLFVLNNNKTGFKIKLHKSTIILTVFALYTMVSFVWSEYDMVSFIQRYRYILSAYIVFYVSQQHLSVCFYKWFHKFLVITTIINTVFVIFQNIGMSLHSDFCNGIFGYVKYNNAGQGIFCLFVTLYAINLYFENRNGKKEAIVLMLFSCIACAVAEIKIFFVLFVIGALLIIIPKLKDKKKKLKIVGIIVVAIVLVLVSYNILLQIMPENLRFFISLSDYIEYEEYGARGGAGRLNQLSYIYEREFGNSVIQALFGNGIGSDSSEYAYELGKTFYQFGILGIILLYAFFIINIRDLMKKSESYNTVGIVFSVLVMISVVVWNCTFNRMCILVFLGIAMGNRTSEQRKL